ncbi:MAG TPA: hemolysin family protein, partial [Anaerolineaceae bacterium]|nr:hemolysin family protein [Anaerolineaceae bacterium]
MPWYVSIVIISVLLYFHGIFAMYEIAMVSAKKTRLQQRKDEGNEGAAAALELLEDPNQRYLSAIQVMITLIDTLSGGIGGANLSAPLANVMRTVPWLAGAADLLALILVILVITYFSIVAGELIPKRIAVNDPDDVACRLSTGIRSLTKILGPVTQLLSNSTNFGIKLLHIDLQGEPPITEDEIRIYLDQGRDVGVIEQAESDMFSGVFRLGDRRVDALMTPRTELVWIDLEDDTRTIIEEITQSEYSRIPVARGDLDYIVGILDIKELVGVDLNSPDFRLEDYLKEPLFIP